MERDKPRGVTRVLRALLTSLKGLRGAFREEAAFRQELLAALVADASRPGDLGDLRHELRDLAVLDDLQAAIAELEFLAAGGELTGEDQVLGVRGDIGEPAHPRGDVGGRRHQ